jgi:hypothetical protein
MPHSSRAPSHTPGNEGPAIPEMSAGSGHSSPGLCSGTQDVRLVTKAYGLHSEADVQSVSTQPSTLPHGGTLPTEAFSGSCVL